MLHICYVTPLGLPSQNFQFTGRFSQSKQNLCIRLVLKILRCNSLTIRLLSLSQKYVVIQSYKHLISYKVVKFTLLNKALMTVLLGSTYYCWIKLLIIILLKSTISLLLLWFRCILYSENFGSKKFGRLVPKIALEEKTLAN